MTQLSHLYKGNKSQNHIRSWIFEHFKINCFYEKRKKSVRLNIKIKMVYMLILATVCLKYMAKVDHILIKLYILLNVNLFMVCIFKICCNDHNWHVGILWWELNISHLLVLLINLNLYKCNFDSSDSPEDFSS